MYRLFIAQGFRMESRCCAKETAISRRDILGDEGMA
jgi:hypothetical protein